MIKLLPMLQDIRDPSGLQSMPVWEVQDFWVPDITGWEESEPFYKQKSEKLIQTRRRMELTCSITADENFRILSQLKDISDHVKNSSDYDIEYLWFDQFENLEPKDKFSYLCDKPQWSMTRHLDNRGVVAGLIVNLIDNPEGTGTSFSQTYDGEILYSGPTKKGSGIFFINTHELWHEIKNFSDNNRYILFATYIISSKI